MLCERNQQHWAQTPDTFGEKNIQSLLRNFNAIIEDLHIYGDNTCLTESSRA